MTSDMQSVRARLAQRTGLFRQVQNPRKVVFLDIDGVVHPLGVDNGTTSFDDFCMNRLKRICEEGEADIVLSSSWRVNDFGIKHINRKLEKHGIGRIIGVTPQLSQQCRSAEIMDWVQKHPSVERYVAIDDIDLAADETAKIGPSNRPLARHFVRTNSKSGLSDANAEQAIRILNG
jgi:hypothetical protein